MALSRLTLVPVGPTTDVTENASAAAAAKAAAAAVAVAVALGVMVMASEVVAVRDAVAMAVMAATEEGDEYRGHPSRFAMN
jgi:hypothetical protein